VKKKQDTRTVKRSLSLCHLLGGGVKVVPHHVLDRANRSLRGDVFELVKTILGEPPPGEIVQTKCTPRQKGK
jgi:hypothetical protein